MGSQSRKPIVIVSYSASNRDPLTKLLFDALSLNLDVRYFTWRRAVLGRYDVLNLHWPDHLTKRHGRVKTWFRWGLYLLVLLRTRYGRPALVRTLHNLAPHEGRRGVELALLRLTDRWTDSFITMQPDPPIATGAPITFVPQGHYRDVYAGIGDARQESGRLLFFGIVRGYKGVPELLEAFSQTEDDALNLHIAGRVFDPELGEQVEAAAAADERVHLRLDWIPHEGLAEEVRRSELVILPYREIFNSGTVIVALSMDRPVLVPSDSTTQRLASEVGPGWVFMYQPPLSATDITDTLDALRAHKPSGRPDLAVREWTEIANAYTAVFKEAIHAHRHR